MTTAPCGFVMAICGFEWKSEIPFHVHICQSENHEDDEYIPEWHVCYCGESRERERGEKSYEAPPREWPLQTIDDDDIPF